MRGWTRSLVGAGLGAAFFMIAVLAASPDRQPRMFLIAAGIGAVVGALSGATFPRS